MLKSQLLEISQINIFLNSFNHVLELDLFKDGVWKGTVVFYYV